jgi:hypothetical protein
MPDIAYLPLDIPKFDILDIVNQYKFQAHNKWPHAWDCLPVCGKTEGWDAESFYDAFVNRFNEGEVKWNVPELKDVLKYYPGEVTFAQILNQKTTIPAHQDYPIIKKQAEPGGFRILMNPVLEKSFFVKIDGKRQFVALPEDTSCFFMNEHEVFHGSVMPEHPKYLISVFGIIDDAAHKDLIDRSLSKYGDEYAIYF